MSFETEPVGLAVSIAPPSAPISTAASASTSHRVRKGSLLMVSSLLKVPGGPWNARASRNSRLVLPSKQLMPRYEMCAPILLPARFVVFGAEWPLFAPAHRIHAVGRNAK